MNTRRIIKRPLAIMLSFCLLVSGLFLNPSPAQAEVVDLPYGSVKNVSFQEINAEPHWYSIDTRQHEAFTVRLDADLLYGGELNLQLYDKDYHFLYEYNYNINGTRYTGITDGLWGTVGYMADTGGRYYIKVTGSPNAAGSYKLIRYHSWNDAGATSQENAAFGFTTARYLQSGTYEFNSARKWDIYRFTAQEGAKLDAAVKNNMASGNIIVRLFDRDINLIAEYSYVDGNGEPQYYLAKGKTGVVSQQIEESGLYYLSIYTDSQTQGNYNLTVTGADPDRDIDRDGMHDDQEYFYRTNPFKPDIDNDGVTDRAELLQGRYPTTAKEYSLEETGAAGTLQTAQEIPYMDEAFKANIKEETWYKFNLKANEGVTVLATSSLDEGDIHLQLFDATGEAVSELGREDWAANIYGGQTIAIDYQASQDGVYYVRVKGEMHTTGNYLMAVYGNWYNAGVNDHSRKFYSSMGASRELSPGNKTLSPLKEDYYHFTAQAGAQLKIDATPHLNTGVLYMELYDENYNLLTTSEVDGYIDSEFGNGETGTVSYVVPASGVYYLAVYGDSSASGSYGLDVSGAKVEPAIPQKRLAGSNRHATAVEVSKEGWATGAEAVVLARDDNFPDALAGAPLAYEYNAPILLTDSKALTPATEAEIDRLKAKKVFILGATGAVSADIENKLKNKGLEVIRLGGKDRYETSAIIAKYLGHKGKAVIASGLNFPDALAVSPWAANQGIPILLTDTNILPDSTKQTLKDLEVTESIVVGGTGVVSANVASQLTGVKRYSGQNRYQTAIDIANGLGSNTETIYLATGENFPDALAGSVLAARTNSPIILTDGNLSEGLVRGYLTYNTGSVQNIYVLGGSSVVPQAVVNLAAQKVN